MTIRVLAALMIIDLLTFGVHPAKADPKDAPNTVAVVGHSATSVKDISHRLKTEQAYENLGTTEEVALISLINDAIEHEVARVHGIAVTQEEIKTFAKYVDENTKAPEILQKVKLAFGDDSASYERLFLVPKIINRKLRQFYNTNPEIHKTERKTIEKAYSVVSSGKSFQEAADQLGLQFKAFEVGSQDTAVPEEFKKHTDDRGTPSGDPLIPILEKLSPGEICKRIVEDDYSYRVIRLKERKGNKYEAEAIAVYKRPFDEWFKKEVKKIRIEILDTELKKSIRTRYPNVWWTHNLSP